MLVPRGRAPFGQHQEITPSGLPMAHILVPRAYDPFGLWLGSRALAGPDILSMRRVFVSHCQPIRFAGFDGKSVIHGLPVLDQTRALDPNHRPKALGTRMPLARSNTGGPRFTDFPSLCACSESSLTNVIGSGFNLLCSQSHSKTECRWIRPEVVISWC